MKTGQTIKVTVFSSDDELVGLLKSEPFRGSELANQNIKYQVSNGLGQAKEMLESDVVVYDLDLALKDEIDVIEDVLHVRLNSGSKPLIFLGGKAVINKTRNSHELDSEVFEALVKPIRPSQLQVIVETITPKQERNTGQSIFMAIAAVITALTVSAVTKANTTNIAVSVDAANTLSQELPDIQQASLLTVSSTTNANMIPRKGVNIHARRQQ